jgi:hypothetical protein
VKTIHEEWKVAGPIGLLDEPLFHYPHPTISEFLKEINFYTTLKAQELYREGVWVGAEPIILYPIGKFIKNYILKLGFLDGTPGFMLSMMMSFHSFLTRAKLWTLEFGQGNK